MSSSALSPEQVALSPECSDINAWFCERVRRHFEQNIEAIVVYGPAVTRVFNWRHHYLHHLLIIRERRVDQLLELGEASRRAARSRVAPPLIITADALPRSYDVFPLEWLDIALFHLTVFGQATIRTDACQPPKVRLQCERELRSLDLQLQRGILASHGDERRIGRLEDEASDTLVRTLRGIVWLSGDHSAYLPDDVVTQCETVVRRSLEGCRQAIRRDGRHDRKTMAMLLNELGLLSDWIDAQA